MSFQLVERQDVYGDGHVQLQTNLDCVAIDLVHYLDHWEQFEMNHRMDLQMFHHNHHHYTFQHLYEKGEGKNMFISKDDKYINKKKHYI